MEVISSAPVLRLFTERICLLTWWKVAWTWTTTNCRETTGDDFAKCCDKAERRQRLDAERKRTDCAREQRCANAADLIQFSNKKSAGFDARAFLFQLV